MRGFARRGLHDRDGLPIGSRPPSTRNVRKSLQSVNMSIHPSLSLDISPLPKFPKCLNVSEFQTGLARPPPATPYSTASSATGAVALAITSCALGQTDPQSPS